MTFTFTFLSASLFVLKSQGVNFHVIDLDPYGSAAPFLDSAVQNIASGGLMCITCTDMAVLCASYPETCYAKYSSIPLKGDNAHEAVRLLVLLDVFQFYRHSESSFRHLNQARQNINALLNHC